MELSELVKGVGHLGIKVSRMDEAISYYCEKLGFGLGQRKVVVDTQGNALEAVFLQLGNLVLELFKPAFGYVTEDANAAGAWDHYAIDAPDFDKCMNESFSKGMQLDASTPQGKVFYDHIGPNGVMGINFKGCSGEVIELCHDFSKTYGKGSGLSGWSHLAIKVLDLNRSVAFYEQLGFSKCADGYLDTPKGRLLIQFMTLGDFQLEMIQVCESMRGELAGRRAGAIDHLAIEVTDGHEVLRICKERKIKLLTPTVRELSLLEHGVQYVMIEGTDGEIIELCQKNRW